MDASLGFAAGVMTAASFWSLLLPAIEIAEHQYGEDNKFFALIPIVVGFVLGALFVYLADIFLPDDVINYQFVVFHLQMNAFIIELDNAIETG